MCILEEEITEITGHSKDDMPRRCISLCVRDVSYITNDRLRCFKSKKPQCDKMQTVCAEDCV
jgi:hypothetical protein